MNKTSLTIISLGLVVALFIIFSSGGSGSSLGSKNNVEVRDGVQYISIDAKGGYYPNKTIAKAGIPTKLIMKTGGTFDCSAALVIRDIDYRNILPQSGETEIDIGIPKVGEPLEGLCSMGMYNFSINFE